MMMGRVSRGIGYREPGVVKTGTYETAEHGL